VALVRTVRSQAGASRDEHYFHIDFYGATKIYRGARAQCFKTIFLEIKGDKIIFILVRGFVECNKVTLLPTVTSLS